MLGYVGGISADDKKILDPAEYAGTTHVGKISVERSFEADLHGTSGHEDVVVNVHGRKMQVLDRVRSLPGRDVILTIDMNAQLAADTALQGRRGAAVAIDPRNGEVLAFVSTPAYDPNAISAGLSRRAYLALQEDIDRPMFNRALRGQYPPGSTIKPMVALAALHYGVVTPERRVGCRGAYSLPGSSHRYRDWKPEGHGSVDLYTAIEQSCDVYFYSVARDLGIERMGGFLTTFGLGDVTGLDIGGEQKGLVPSPAWKKKAFRRPADQVWFPGETVIAGIGQGYLLVTPLQLAHATATVAARGQRFQPTLLKGSRDPATGTIEYEAPKPLPPGAGPGRRALGRDHRGHARRHAGAAGHGPGRRPERAVPDGGQERHRPGLHRGPEREVQREGRRGAPPRPRAVRGLCAARGAAHRRGRGHRERRKRQQGRRAHRARGHGSLPAGRDPDGQRERPAHA